MSAVERRIAALSSAHKQLLAIWLDVDMSGAVADGAETSETNATPEVQPATQQLVAYVTLSPSSSTKQTGDTVPPADIDERELRRFAKTQLPDYMCPAAYVVLEELPRLPNGKLAETKLPAPQQMPSERHPESGDSELPTIQGPVTILTDILSTLLGSDDIRPDDNFFEIGGDSITAIQFVSKARQAGIQLDIAAITAKPTLAELATSLPTHDAASAGEREYSTTGDTPLTPIQQWFFSMLHPVPEHWNQAGHRQLSESADADVLVAAISACMNEHPVFSTRFFYVHGQWQSEIPGAAPPSDLIHRINVRASADVQQIDLHLERLQREFSLADGWLVRFLIVEDESTRATRLCWVAHHLIIDNLSAEIMLSSIEKHYLRLSKHPAAGSIPDNGIPTDSGLSARTVSLREWAIKLQSLRQSRVDATPKSASACTQHQRTIDSNHCNDLPLSAPTEAHCSLYKQLIPSGTSDQLLASNTAYGTQTLELLLTALALALEESQELTTAVLDIETHGRDVLGTTVDTSNSIGWFTTYFPCVIPVTAVTSIGERIKLVKEQYRLQRSQNMHYLLEKISTDNLQGEDIHDAGQSLSILVNYMGDTPIDRPTESALFGRACEVPQSMLRALNNVRSHGLEINMHHENDQLVLIYNHVVPLIDRQSIEQFSQAVLSAISSISVHCTANDAGGYTPSDFPEMDMSQEELDSFLDSID